ncbi:MAG: hypothetical protein II877_13440 [Synergistaceae bacterium]|nr:hypothetical protein [Synergistaceae bacterium]
MKEYVSPTVSSREDNGHFAIPAILASIAAVAASAAVKAMFEEDFSALDAEPLPACITTA